MIVTIYMIEDRGFSKKLNFCAIGSNKVEGFIMVNETDKWFDKEVGDKLILDDHTQNQF